MSVLGKKTVLTEQEVESLLARARGDVAQSADLSELESCRRQYLGRRSELHRQFQSLASMDATDKQAKGAYLNRARTTLETDIRVRKLELAKLSTTSIPDFDVSLPARARYVGGLHPISLTTRRIQGIFLGAGFELREGPEVEDDYHNFDALNIASDHPAREMHDTMYVEGHSPLGRLLLRSHTSPVQIRAMRSSRPPLKIICPGRVYRCDMDVTHTPMFHQVEGLWVDRHINFANLRSTVSEFLRIFFDRGAGLQVRFRTSYFPFTEPSAEVDIGCVRCNMDGCRVCANTGWLEVMGCGMVHPNVLLGAGIDADRWQGIAFGLGVERLAMLYYGIDDLRLLFENAPNFLRQFRGRVV